MLALGGLALGSVKAAAASPPGRPSIAASPSSDAKSKIILAVCEDSPYAMKQLLPATISSSSTAPDS